MQTQVRPRVANAPLSYGAFEITVGTDFQVPDPEDVLGAIGDAGYVGHRPRAARVPRRGRHAAAAARDQPARPRRRLRPRALQRARALGRRPRRASRHTLALFDAARRDRRPPRPVRRRRARADRQPRPRRRGPEPRASTTAAGRRWSTASRAPPNIAREAGYEPVFHHHTSSYVEGLPEIERFLEDTEVDLLLDSGHLAVAGGDPIQGLKDWRERVGVVHLKDTRMDVLAPGPRGARRHDQRLAPRAVLRARRRRRRPRRLLRRAAASGYDGWVVIEQDRVLEGNGAFAHAAQEQRGNREWLKEHAGW